MSVVPLPMRKIDVAIIGAGQAGLAVATNLDKHNVNYVILEKSSQVAAAWESRHDKIVLNTHRKYCVVDHALGGDQFDPYPDRSQFLSHLKRCANQLKGEVFFGTEVLSLGRCDDRWIVHSNTLQLSALHVVVAAGVDARAYLPKWTEDIGPGCPVIHSSEWTPDLDLSEERVLLVGLGNSGIDIGNWMSKCAPGDLVVSLRSMPFVLPKWIGAVAAHRFAGFFERLPRSWSDSILRGIERLAIGDLSGYGLERPAAGHLRNLFDRGVSPSFDDGFFEFVKSSGVSIRPELKSCSNGVATFADGTIFRPTLIIAATGYRPNLSFLEHFEAALNVKGYPRLRGAYKSPYLPGVWFNGMRPSFRGSIYKAATDGRSIAEEVARSLSQS